MKRLWLLVLIATSGAGETGVLEVRTLAEVEVIWEGTELGRTDSDGLLLIAGIPAGDYDVTLRKKGFRQATARISAGAGEKTVLVLSLEPSPAPPALADLVPWEARTAPRDGEEAGGALPVAPEPQAVPAAAEPLAAQPQVRETPEPRPTTSATPTAAATAPRTGAETAPEEPAGERRPVWPWILAALGLPAAWLAARRRKAPAVDAGGERPIADPAWVHAGSESRPLEASLVTAPLMPREDLPRQDPGSAESDPAFLENLKRREHRLAPGEDDEVIDVDFVEVRPAEHDS